MGERRKLVISTAYYRPGFCIHYLVGNKCLGVPADVGSDTVSVVIEMLHSKAQIQGTKRRHTVWFTEIKYHYSVI